MSYEKVGYILNNICSMVNAGNNISCNSNVGWLFWDTAFEPTNFVEEGCSMFNTSYVGYVPVSDQKATLEFTQVANFIIHEYFTDCTPQNDICCIFSTFNKNYIAECVFLEITF